MKRQQALLLILLTSAFALAQTPAKPATARPAAQRLSPEVDNVIQLVKSGMSESLIIRTLRKSGKPVNLTSDDLIKLQKNGVSENIMNVLMDPASAPAPVSPPAPAPSSAPVAPEPTPVPVASVAPSAPSAAQLQAQKKRVIIDEFDYSSVMNEVQAVFKTQQNIGKGIRAMLVKRLAEANQIVVVERAKIDVLQAEQDRNAGNRVKQGSGARVGRIRGADALLTGDIIIFGRDDKHTKVKGAGAGGFIGMGIGAIASGKDKDKAVVAINFRLVDAETSEIVASGEARGESERKSSSLGALGGAFGKGVGGVEVDMTSSNFAQTIIGEATMDCVNKLADQMNKQAPGMQHKAREVEAYVADVSGGSMTISAGANDGVNAGEVFEVLKVLREVKDPVTKEVLDRITEKVGEMTVNTVRDKIATGSYAGSPAQVGFVVRKKL